MSDRYVVVRTVNGYTWGDAPQRKAQAMKTFRWVTGVGSEGAWEPHTGNRARVMAVAEWQRIQAGAR